MFELSVSVARKVANVAKLLSPQIYPALFLSHMRKSFTKTDRQRARFAVANVTTLDRHRHLYQTLSSGSISPSSLLYLSKASPKTQSPALHIA